ncbi:MAG: metallophosphoesterase [Clostridia bacterium]
MSIYTIGDLHLSFKENKPMSIFGDNWEDHEEKIKKDWIEKVKEEDLVILPGDFSWATYLKDTDMDFEYLNSLPGRKLLLKGNHDYWWTTVTSMRNFLQENKFENIDFIYNNSYEFENCIIVGTRGWSQTEDLEDKKILKREALRLELSIQSGIRDFGGNKEFIAFMHYPPISKSNLVKNETNEFIKMMQKYNIKRCFYGHLHSTSIKEAVEGKYFGIDFKLVSADGLDFKLYKIR